MSGIIGIKAQAWLLKKGKERGKKEERKRERRVNPEFTGIVLLIHRTSLCLPLCTITLPFLAKTVSTFDSFLNTNLPSAAGFYPV